MLVCNCGKEYKTTKGLSSHQNKCEYAELDINKVYKIGHMIDEINRKLFNVAIGSIKKFAKVNNTTFDDAKKILQEEAIYKYRKSIWDILLIWDETLLASEYRIFLTWVFKTYRDINLISLRNTLCNRKIIYRFNLETTPNMIQSRIDSSLIYIHENHVYDNDFVFVDHILNGNISMYFVLFNDWLAQIWFARLDMDLQKELEEYVNIASKAVLDRLKPTEFDKLQELANSDTPIIHTMD